MEIDKVGIGNKPTEASEDPEMRLQDNYKQNPSLQT